MNESLKKFMTNVVESTTRDELEATGGINPVVIYGCIKEGRATKLLMMDMDLSSPESKAFSIEILKHTLAETKANLVVSVLESWGLPEDMWPNLQDVYKQYGSIANCPFRKEVLLITIESPWGDWVGTTDLEIKKNRKTFGEVTYFQGQTFGNFANLLPKAA